MRSDKGFAKHLVGPQAEEGDQRCRSHHEEQAGIPRAFRNCREVKEILYLLGIGHARDGKPDAEEDTAGGSGGDQKGAAVDHRACLVA